MSARLSIGLPRACSGDIYAAVPRITPACVISSETVGDMVGLPALEAARSSAAFASPEIQHLQSTLGRDLDVRRLQIAMHDPFLVRRVQCRRQLLPIPNRDIQRHGSLQVLALDQF